jgi:hypothetical protein
LLHNGFRRRDRLGKTMGIIALLRRSMTTPTDGDLTLPALGAGGSAPRQTTTKRLLLELPIARKSQRSQSRGLLSYGIFGAAVGRSLWAFVRRLRRLERRLGLRSRAVRMCGGQH